jgi:hypothetical protein
MKMTVHEAGSGARMRSHENNDETQTLTPGTHDRTQEQAQTQSSQQQGPLRQSRQSHNPCK